MPASYRPINIKEHFGAKGDGVTDDTAAIQAALNSGGSVFIPAGTFSVGPLTLTSNNTSILGEEATLLLRSSGTFLSISASNVKIKNIEFDGNENAVGGILLNDNSSGVLIDSCEIHSCVRTGTTIDGIQFSDGCHDLVVQNCSIHDIYTTDGSPARGIRGQGASSPTSPIKGVRILNNKFDNIYPFNDADGIVIQNWTVDADVVISNNIFTKCAKRAIKIQSPGVVATSNICQMDNVGGGTDPYTAISIYGSNVVVNGNSIAGRCTDAGIEIGTSSSATFTADSGTEIITSSGHQLTNGSLVNLTTTGTLPGGLSSSRDYYVINATTNTFQVSLSSQGSAVNITSAGSGTHTWRSAIANVTVSSNIVAFDSHANASCDGIDIVGICNVLSINNNTIKGTHRYGIRVNAACRATSINANSFDGGSSSVLLLSGGPKGVVITGNIATNHGHWFIHDNNTGTASDIVFSSNQSDGSGFGFWGNATLRRQLVDGNNTIGIRHGTGSPNGSVTAPIGNIYLQTDGSINNTLYIKESGTGNTGWTPISRRKEGQDSLGIAPSALTINFDTGNYDNKTLVLFNTDCILTLSATRPGIYHIIATQASNGNEFVYPNNVLWVGTPRQPTAQINSVSVIQLYFDGQNFHGA